MSTKNKNKNKPNTSTDLENKIITRDYKNFIIDPVDIAFGGNIILDSTKLSIQYGEHYGLIGKNGIGKTSLLNAIAERKLDVPDRLDMVYVKQEEPESDLGVVEIILKSDTVNYPKYQRLNELEELVSSENISSGADGSLELDDLMLEYDRLSREIGSDESKARARAQKILFGLGFNGEDQLKKVKSFSGGWRMRISLAKALFMTPTLLILDEPTNHLDLHANLWLTNYLKNYPKTILVVSHDQFFVDEVCTTIIHIHNKKLNYYKGNYAKFQKIYTDELTKIQNDWDKFKKKIDSMRKAKKSQAEIDLYVKKNPIVKPDKEYEVKINFLQPTLTKGIFLTMENVSFGYEENQTFRLLYHNLNFELQSDSRVAIVGKNGVGKSTLLKLLVGELEPIEGEIMKNSSLRIGYYGQHFEETMPMDISGVAYLQKLNSNIDLTSAHKFLALFGLESDHHSTLIGSLSGGQKARLCLSSFAVMKPHLLVLDEPTNHLDIVAMESLIDALNKFEGAVVLVTHNFDLITKINCELWCVDEDGLHRYDGNYDDYIAEVVGEIESI